MSRRSKPTRKSSRTSPRRRQLVWLALIGGMTTVGGLLLALEDRRSAPPLLTVLDRAGGMNTGQLDDIFSRADSIESGRWQSIVIHHSGSLSGSTDSIDRAHTESGLNGLGYHFVITNGQGGADGTIHVSKRWIDQMAGAHTSGPQSEFFNNHGVGICLVGDGERRRFTEEQLASLVELIGALQTNLEIRDEMVLLHREVAPSSSPGRLFPESALRRSLMTLGE